MVAALCAVQQLCPLELEHMVHFSSVYRWARHSRLTHLLHDLLFLRATRHIRLVWPHLYNMCHNTEHTILKELQNSGEHVGLTQLTDSLSGQQRLHLLQSAPLQIGLMIRFHQNIHCTIVSNDNAAYSGPIVSIAVIRTHSIYAPDNQFYKYFDEQCYDHSNKKKQTTKWFT